MDGDKADDGMILPLHSKIPAPSGEPGFYDVITKLHFFHIRQGQGFFVFAFGAGGEEDQGARSSGNGGGQENGELGQVQEGRVSEGDGSDEDGHGEDNAAKPAGGCQFPGRGFAGDVYIS